MRRLTEAELAEREAARAAKREANRQRWEADSANANVRNAAAKEAIKPIPVELLPAPESSGALGRLRQIMADHHRPIYQRAEAASAILAYELSPASLVNVPSEEVAASSFKFLQAVADAPDTPEPLRLKVLRDVASIENARASKVDPTAALREREHMRNSVNAARHEQLRLSGCGRPEPEQWYLTSADQFEMPQLPEPAMSLDELVAMPEDELHRLVEARQQALLEVTATNRDDRSWRQLLTQPK